MAKRATIPLTAALLLGAVSAPAHDLPGDLNCDGAVNAFDVDAFTLALTNPEAYCSAYRECNRLLADINCDGAVNGFDVDAFLGCLVAGGCEPCLCRMVRIPGGSFVMGNVFPEDGDWLPCDDELPLHTVYIYTFYMDSCELTNARYATALNWALAHGGLISVVNGQVYRYGTGMSCPYCATTAYTPYSQITWDGSAFGVVAGKESFPMGSVTWWGAAAYCNWRSAMEGRPPAYDVSTWVCDFDAPGYRLPTEAEWEQAARGGVPGGRFPWSDQGTIEHHRCNYRSAHMFYDDSPYYEFQPCWAGPDVPIGTNPVGFFSGALQSKADWGWPGLPESYQTENADNGYGLHDVAGNVFEWCNDWYDQYYYSTSPGDNPSGPASGIVRVLRGGSFLMWPGAPYCRVCDRHKAWPDNWSSSFGFRCVLATSCP